jgi:putative effector of murein hydrolase
VTPFRLWVYLQTTPLFWLTATLAAFLVADALAKAAGRRPIVNHVLIAIALLGGLLKLTGTDYQTYFNGAQFVHFLLGPATVALGVPIYANFALVRRNVWPLAAALLIGATVAIASAVLVAKAFGAPRAVLIALAPKSITAGVAMAVTEALGGAPPLTAVLVIATGILGAVIVTPLMDALGVTDYAARGFAVGLASHGIGTARLRGRSGRRRVRWPRHGTQRHRHPRGDPGAPALADRVRTTRLTASDSPRLTARIKPAPPGSRRPPVHARAASGSMRRHRNAPRI